MASPADDVLARALKLPAEDRERVAAELVASLDREVDPSVEQAWLELAERRAREVIAGAPGVPWNEIRERVSQRRRSR